MVSLDFLNNDGTLTDGDVLSVEWPNVTFLNKEGEQVTNDMSKGEGKLPWRLELLPNGKY